MAQQINIKLHFLGGPLDGTDRLQQIPADWGVIRYEHMPRTDAKSKHVYSGLRKPEDREVRLRYVGAQQTEAAT